MKVKLLAFLLIGVIISACTNTENFPVEDNIKTDQSRGEAYYFCINLTDVSSSVTRTDSELSDGFEKGTEEEGKVNSISLFFFNEEGEGIKVKGSDSSSELSFAYIWKPTDSDVQTNENDYIEEKISALLRLEFENNKLPSQVIAIINPNQSFSDLYSSKDTFSLSDLQYVVSDFQSGLTDSNFVMSNSVYRDDSASSGGGIICATPISERNFSPSESAAKQNPVTIYVERVVARFDFTIDMKHNAELSDEGMENVYKINNQFNIEGEEGDDKELYVKFLGWAVTSTPKVSRLLKKVDSSWDDSSFFSDSYSWNSSKYFRSYWAINPEDPGHQWFSYNNLIRTETTDRAEGYNDFSVKTAYMQENANPCSEGEVSPAAPTYPTKVVFAAQIIDSEGKPVTIAEYRSQYYSLDNLKTLAANRLDMYYENGADESGNKKYTKIGSDDLDFETSMQHNNESGPGNRDTYYVYFKLKEKDSDGNVINRTWYQGFGENEDKDYKIITNPNEYISSQLYRAKIWNNGYTYYFVTIPHRKEISETRPGHYGVIRNSLYSASINGILSLGTPVYNPDEIIYPENPGGQEEMDIYVEIKKWTLRDPVYGTIVPE